MAVIRRRRTVTPPPASSPRGPRLETLAVVLAFGAMGLSGCSTGGITGESVNMLDREPVSTPSKTKQTGDRLPTCASLRTKDGYFDMDKIVPCREKPRQPRATTPAEVRKMLNEWGSTPAGSPSGTYCEDITTYDYNWYNDMRCHRLDGSVFLTDYGGANRFLADY